MFFFDLLNVRSEIFAVGFSAAKALVDMAYLVSQAYCIARGIDDLIQRLWFLILSLVVRTDYSTR